MRTLFLLLFLATTPLQAEWQRGEVAARPVQEGVTYSEAVARQPGESVRLRWVKWERGRATLRVVPLGRSESVAAAARKGGAIAAINGGYFQKDNTPLGLVVADGVSLHPRQKSRILSGLLAVSDKGAFLRRNAEVRPGAPLRQALQAGPFLVDGGKPVPGLNATRSALRTVLVADAKGVCALLTTGPVTLAALGELLATPGVLPGVKVERALNLDGGSSTALWVGGEPVLQEGKPVRNAVLLVR